MKRSQSFAARVRNLALHESLIVLYPFMAEYYTVSNGAYRIGRELDRKFHITKLDDDAWLVLRVERQ